jgi:glycosyltransferase involved in cell wall biosynthesis
MLDVIIPAYNAHKTIGQTIDSIVVQTYKDKTKITIVNDCSEKDYSEFVEKYKIDVNSSYMICSETAERTFAKRCGLNPTEAEETFPQ